MEVLENLQFEGEIFFKLQEAEREAQLTGQRYSSQDVLQAMKITILKANIPHILDSLNFKKSGQSCPLF